VSSYWINPVLFLNFSDRVCGPADTDSPSLLSYVSPAELATGGVIFMVYAMKQALGMHEINPRYVCFPFVSGRVCGPADTASPFLLSYVSPAELAKGELIFMVYAKKKLFEQLLD